MIYDINKYSVFSLFSLFLKINYDSDVYLLFRKYVNEKWSMQLKNYNRYNKSTYFCNCLGFEDYCKKEHCYRDIVTKWYKFLYENTNLSYSLKSQIKMIYL